MDDGVASRQPQVLHDGNRTIAEYRDGGGRGGAGFCSVVVCCFLWLGMASFCQRGGEGDRNEHSAKKWSGTKSGDTTEGWGMMGGSRGTTMKSFFLWQRAVCVFLFFNRSWSSCLVWSEDEEEIGNHRENALNLCLEWDVYSDSFKLRGVAGVRVVEVKVC